LRFCCSARYRNGRKVFLIYEERTAICRDFHRFRVKFDPDPAWRAASTGAPFDAIKLLASRR
jgi:hypothetical protein